jgi:Flp pilus assembly protein TadG
MTQRRFVHRGRAQVILWFTVAVPLFVSMAGLAIDGGQLLSSRRQLQSVADGAARAGATRLDTPRLRASGGTDIQLDASAAQQAAHTYVDEALGGEQPGWQGPPRTSVDVGERRVRVSIQATLQTAFLRIVRIDAVPVEASAVADVQFGIHDGKGG